MADLYSIKKDSFVIRSKISSLMAEVYTVPDFSSGFLTTADSDQYPVEANAISKVNKYKSDLLKSYSDIMNMMSVQLENRMQDVISHTRDIVDELFLIRSLEFPELEGVLLQLREFTLSSEILEPRYQEARELKYSVSNAMSQSRPYAAQDKYDEMSARTEVLKAEILESNLAEDFITQSNNYFNNQINEAASYLANKLYFPLYISNRYSNLEPVAQICIDETNIQRYSYNCMALKTIYGVSPQSINAMNEEKLRYLEGQMDKVYERVVSYD